jgi:hypothetical protein
LFESSVRKSKAKICKRKFATFLASFQATAPKCLTSPH